MVSHTATKGRRETQRKGSNKAFKAKVTPETQSTVKTAAGAIYRKSDIAKARVKFQDQKAYRRSPTGEESKKKQQKKAQRKSEEQEEFEDSWSEDEVLPPHKKIGSGGCKKLNFKIVRQCSPLRTQCRVVV